MSDVRISRVATKLDRNHDTPFEPPGLRSAPARRAAALLESARRFFQKGEQVVARGD